MNVRTTSTAAALTIGLVLHLPAQEMTQRRTVLVSVIDGDGNAVSDLTAVNFRAELQGEAVSVLSATLDTSPRQVAVVIDASASMDSFLRPAMAVAETMVLGLVPHNRVSILSLDSALHQHAGPSFDSSVLLRALSDVRAGGPSALYGGIYAAMEALPWAPLGDAICLITDGGDTRSVQTPRDIQAAGSEKGIRVFVAWLRPTRGTESRLTDNRNEMTNIAEGTGGRLLQVNHGRAEDNELSVRLLLAGITQSYRVELELAQPIDRASEWDLTVVDADGEELSGIHVAYPRFVVRR